MEQFVKSPKLVLALISAGFSMLTMSALSVLPNWAAPLSFALAGCLLLFGIIAGVWFYRHRWSISMVNSILIIIFGGALLLAGGITVWIGVRGYLGTFEPPTEKNNVDIKLLAGTMQFNIDYPQGSSYGQNEWDNRLTYSKVTIWNKSNKTYEDFQVGIRPELQVVYAKAISGLVECKIDPDYSLVASDQMVVRSSVLLYCPRLPAGASVTVDFVTAPKMPNIHLPDFYGNSPRRPPTFVDLSVSTNFGDQQVNVNHRALFKPMSIPTNVGQVITPINI